MIKKRRINGIAAWTSLVAVAVAVLGLTLTPIANADIAPPPGVPKTVSADPQPTVQINGVVWDQTVHGRKVYAVGNFTQARPAGVAINGPGTVTRMNILAYDIITGQLDTSFVHTLVDANAPSDANARAQANKVGRSVRVSPDGTKLYVGGKFTHVDGVAKSNFAAINLKTGALLSGYPAPNAPVNSIAVDSARVYIGGEFTRVSSSTRNRMAAYKTDGTLDGSWVAQVNGSVNAIVAVGGKVVIGGLFTKINNATYYSVGAVSATNGRNLPWASQSPEFPILLQDPTGKSGTGVTSMSTDGNQVYMTAFTYIFGAKPNTFEGRWAIRVTDGSLVWMNDCVGDSYSVYPVGGVVYSASHAHSCKSVGGFPEIVPKRAQHGLAETTYVSGKNISSEGGEYPSYVGQPAALLLHWYPRFTPAPGDPTPKSPIVSGSWQAGWSVTGTVINGVSYVAYGGEFTQVEGKNQQGLVRFKTTGTTRTATENAIGPHGGKWNFQVNATPATSTGASRLTTDIQDPDNGTLTYDVYRADDKKRITTRTVRTDKTTLNTYVANVNGIIPNTTQRYYMVARDSFGNSYTGRGIMDNTHKNITYSSTGWSSLRNTAEPNANRTVHSTQTANATVTGMFFGSSVSVIANKQLSGGRIGITIDNNPEVVVNTAFTGGVPTQQRVYTKTGLTLNTHEIRIRNIDAGKKFMFDGLELNNNELFYDDNYTDNGVAYTGAWTNRQNYKTGEMNGGTHYTSDVNASMSFKFKGRTMVILSLRHESRDTMRVTVGGITKDCNTAGTYTGKSTVVCTFTNLAPNVEHTAVVKKKTANTRTIVVDGFIVRP